MKKQLPIVRTAQGVKFGITHTISGNYVTLVCKDDPYYRPRIEIYCQPEIGQKYQVVYYCDYDNSEHGLNYIVEVTEDNIAEVAFDMNDTQNDITEYILTQ